MSAPTLYEAGARLADASQGFSNADLAQPFSWRAHHVEGIRFALLGTYHDLRHLAVRLIQRREQQDLPRTLAQHALAPYHLAYRELQATLVGVPGALYEELPAPGEWHLRDVLTHVINTERTFFTLVHYGLSRQRTDEDLPAQLPEGEVQRIVDSPEAFAAVWRDGTVSELLSYFDRLHQRVLREFSQINDQEIEGPSVWWEGEELSLQYRLHRFDAHLRQHTIQIEMTLEALGQSSTEARHLIRLLYRALAHVENAVLGADDFGQREQRALAEEIIERAANVEARVQQSRRMVQAALAGEVGVVRELLQDSPRLAQCVDDNQVPLARSALYRGHQDIANRLVAAWDELDIFTAAALGRLDQVEARVAEWDGYANETSRDGFSPLQLACFFGRETTALWLLEHGADVEAVSQNEQRIRPLHAAAANGNMVILRALLAKGADVNARQQQDFTPLHTAADSGNDEMARLFLEYNADTQSRDAQGRTAAQLAQERGHEALAALLS